MDRAATTGTFGTGADTRPPDVGKRIHSRRMLVDASTLPEPHRSGGPRDYSWLSPSAIGDSLRQFQSSTGRPGRGRKSMRNRLASSLFAGCAALLTAGGAGAQAPSPAVQAIPASTPEAPRDADGNLMIGKPFVACGPTTGSQIGILPNSVRNTSAQNAAASANAGRGAAAGADG